MQFHHIVITWTLLGHRPIIRSSAIASKWHCSGLENRLLVRTVFCKPFIVPLYNKWRHYPNKKKMSARETHVISFSSHNTHLFYLIVFVCVLFRAVSLEWSRTFLKQIKQFTTLIYMYIFAAGLRKTVRRRIVFKLTSWLQENHIGHLDYNHIL